jgi:hypothetical protein
MAEIINLRRARKDKARAAREAAAAENRVRHGRSRADKRAGDAADELARRRHEGHRLETDGDS